MADYPIEFKNVSFFRAGQAILDSFSLRIAEGETLVLLGRSGCGKTTALKLVNRLLEPTSGEVMVDSRDTRQWDAIQLRRRVGYVIQETGLFPHYTVGRNVALVPELEGWDDGRIRQRVDQLLKMVRLDPDEFRDRLPSRLSGGQRQRVGVARALAADPPILILDEPFGALDPLSRADLQREFRLLQKELRKCVLFVTHDLAEAFLLGDRIALMDRGKICFEGSAEQLHHSRHPEVRRFLTPFREAFASFSLAP